MRAADLIEWLKSVPGDTLVVTTAGGSTSEIRLTNSAVFLDLYLDSAYRVINNRSKNVPKKVS